MFTKNIKDEKELKYIHQKKKLKYDEKAQCFVLRFLVL